MQECRGCTQWVSAATLVGPHRLECTIRRQPQRYRYGYALEGVAFAVDLATIAHATTGILGNFTATVQGLWTTHSLFGARKVPVKGTAPDAMAARVPSAATAAARVLSCGLLASAAAKVG